MRFMVKHWVGFFSIFFYFSHSLLSANEDYTLDATSLSFEELINTKYIPASHIANQMNNAASAVSIVTAKDIRDYGYRSLKDILSSMKGLHFTKDPAYSFLGGRGFSSPSEYAGRIIVLIDGYRADDSYYGQTYFENDGLLDVSLIERVEFIPSGGSAGYSNGALLGVINIITKNGSDIDGATLALGVGSYNGRGKRVNIGNKFENGLDLLFSVSTLQVDNKDYAGENPWTHEQISGDGGKEQNKRIFLKASYENLRLTSALSKRDISLAAYPIVGFAGDSPDNYDENFFTHLKYDTDISKDLKLSSSLWYGYYSYDFVDDVDPSVLIWKNGTRAKWHGADVKFVGTWFSHHTISFGLDYRNDFRWSSYDDVQDPFWGDFFEITAFEPRKTYSGYVYDDFALSEEISLNYGFRYEKNDKNYKEMSPYGAFIWQALKDTRLKLSVSEVFRQPTAYEEDRKKPEKAQTLEFVLEQNLGYETKLTSSLYRYVISNSYGSSSPDKIEAKGFEVELEKHWEGGSRLKTNYTWQDATDANSNELRVNSPHHIAKLNLSMPFISRFLRLGAEVQYVSKRLMSQSSSGAGKYAPAYTIANLNLLAQEVVPNLDISLNIHNVFNRHYDNVLSYDLADGKPTLLDDGRVFWLQMEYKFK